MQEQNSQINIERNLTLPLVIATAILAISGFATLYWPEFPPVKQFVYLLHTFIGVFFSILIVPYLWVHFRRTLVLRRFWLAFSGIVTAVMVLMLPATGIHIAVMGQSEALSWILPVHIYLALAILLLIAAHIVFHVLSMPERRKKADPNRFPSLPGTTAKYTIYGILTSLLTVSVLSALYVSHDQPFNDNAVITPYQYTYGEHPFRPSQTETSTGGFFDVKRVGGSERCATCHTQIAQQWQASIHSQASSDKAYQTNIKLLSEKKGMAATRYCEGCHAPVALLSGQLTQGGKLDTPGHLQQGVSCMGCHGIAKVEHTKGVASYLFQPPTHYLFDSADSAWQVYIHNFLIRIKPEQHKADLAKPVLGSTEICATCHAQFMDKDFNNWGWVKMQDDYTAWLNGPYSGQTRQTFAHTQQSRCQDCHFPLQPGKDPSANQAGLIKTHFNIAANTAIPYVTGNQEQLAQTIKFLKEDKVRISIDNPNRVNANISGKHIATGLLESTEAPAFYYLGEEVLLKVAVTNASVGHAFPGGTSDVNEAWIHFMVNDGQGRVVYDSGFIDSNGTVDGKAYFYKTIPIDRFGNEVWRHDLFNMVGDSFKRLIAPGASDVTTYQFKIPDDVKSPLIVTAGLNYRKLNNRYAKWALKDENIRLPVVEMASTSLVLSVKNKPDVATIEQKY